jgi:two-component system cell cycle response regulator CpdR
MKHVLVVDDDNQILQMVKLILECEGLVPHCVSSGEEALQKIVERTFSLMITDLNMPGLDGLELSRKGLEIAPQMPILMITAEISAKIIRQAMEIGISNVLAKPYHLKEMLMAIRDILGNRSERVSPTGNPKRRIVGGKILFNSLSPGINSTKSGVADFGFYNV